MQIKIHNEVKFFFIISILLILIFLFFSIIIGLIFLIISCYIFYFFRDPKRFVPDEDVIVSPTQQEISNAVEIFNYSEDNPSPHRRCPITMDEFNMDDRVTRIRQCGHMFHEDAINNWFRVNVRCPVCRYDIREYTNTTTRTSVDTSNNTTDVQDQSIDHITNQITTEITNMLAQALGSSAQTTTNDVSQNSVFTFDIPITITSSYENEYDEDDEIEDIEDVE